MLKQRIATAVVLLAVLIPALLAASAWPFAVLTLLFIGAAGWEWARLNGAPGLAILMGGALALACAAAAWLGWVQQAPDMAWWLAMLAWVLGGAWLLRGGPAAWPAIPAALRWCLGLLLLWTAWLALAHARTMGINFILSVFCLVWVSDIAAYFGGRAFGRRKLALAISPGKSWEGVWSGMLAVLVVAWLWASFIDGRGRRRFVEHLQPSGAAHGRWPARRWRWCSWQRWAWSATWSSRSSSAAPAPRTAVACCPATAACSTGSTPCCRCSRSRWH